ncbi:MAG TPA: orotate phosphoribosyltransferase [Anaerolineae bacterium]|nr:orotate phosphoribosyltransferase [Anaerolineae bacterium]
MADGLLGSLCGVMTHLSYRKKDVVLASGKKSDFYIAVGETLANPEGLHMASEIVLDRIVDLFPGPGEIKSVRDLCPTTIQAVAGVALGGVPLASAVTLAGMHHEPESVWLPTLIVRKEPKGHGAGGQIIGMEQFKRGLGMAPVVLLEDVVTTGGSSLRAAQVLKDAGARVEAIIALVDRQEGAAEAIAEAGFVFSSILARSDFPS